MKLQFLLILNKIEIHFSIDVIKNCGDVPSIYLAFFRESAKTFNSLPMHSNKKNRGKFVKHLNIINKLQTMRSVD